MRPCIYLAYNKENTNKWNLFMYHTTSYINNVLFNALQNRADEYDSGIIAAMEAR